MRKIATLLLALFFAAPAAQADQFNIPFALKSKIINATRDLTAATASVAYTGVGFKPRAIIAFGTVNSVTINTYTTYVGAADSGLIASSMSPFGTGNSASTTTLLGFFDTGASNFQSATVASMDADGFTLSWTKTGVPTGTAQLLFLCLQ